MGKLRSDLSSLSPAELEEEADKLLSDSLKDRRRNKTRTTEYPILSQSQMDRRHSSEIPFSNLSSKQRHELHVEGIDWDESENPRR